MFSANLRKAFVRWVRNTGGSIETLAGELKESKYTVSNYFSPSKPAMPRADLAARICRILGTTVESCTFDDDPAEVSAFVPFSDIIQDLNALPDYRLDDVRRLIQPWAMEARGAAQQVIDIVEDLKVLPASRLDDVRRLVKPWAEEARRNPDSTERASATA